MLRSCLFAAFALACIAVANAQDVAPPLPADARVYDMGRLCARSANQTRFFPPRAMAQTLPGEAMIDCVLNDDSTLHTCQIVHETPSGYGFGEAALRVACRARTSAWEATDANNTPYVDENGQRHVRSTIRFRIGGESPAPSHGNMNN
ncbi:MAG: energy transducer TonB [Hyphomonadaceae bacterium]|nr:energy transducer TonB [Hyphomonadaceae bacterium]